MRDHKKLNTTLLCTQLGKTLFTESIDEFAVKAARDHEKTKTFLEVGFEHVCEKDRLMFFRK